MGDKSDVSQVSDIQIGISIFRQPLSWIKQAVESALHQNGDLKITCSIRIDGPRGCDVEAKDWLTQLTEADDSVNVIFGESQLGTFGSYKEIFDHGDSEYICQLDADDWLDPDAVSYCLIALKNNLNSSFAYTNYKEVDEYGKFIRFGLRSEKEFSMNRQLVQFNTFHLRVIRRGYYKMSGGYNEKLEYTGDYDLSMKLAELSLPTYVPQALYNYRIHRNNTSSKKQLNTIEEAFSVASKALYRRKQQHLLELNLLSRKNMTTPTVTLSHRKGPIIVAGMHRSATSILSLVLQEIGINLGNNLIAADTQNPDGYGEDLKVVEINRSALQRTTNQGSKGWKDWGWANNQSATPVSHSDKIWKHQAQSYIKQRADSKEFWGWKDPRNTLFLEDWISLEPNIKVIGIYRYPWEIIGALQRLQPPIFAKEPSWCLEIWNHYNSYLLSFAEKHPDQCILVNSTSFTENPLDLISAIKKKWGWPQKPINSTQATSIKNLIKPNLHRKIDLIDPLVKLHFDCSPRSMDILKRLDCLAELPSSFYPDYITSWNKAENTDHRSPVLSIILTSFNQGEYLLEALASAEKYRDPKTSELIIIDDGSNDRRTCEVLSNLNNKGYTVIRQHNQGLPSARNKGINHSKGEFILFLDDDNRLLSPYFNKGVGLMLEDDKIDVVYGDRINFGLQIGPKIIGKISEEKLWEMNVVDNCALIRKKYLERCGGYSRELTGLGFEDWDLWLSGLNHREGLRMKYINEFCFEYRVRPSSMLQQLFHDELKQKDVIHILRKRHGNKIGSGGFNVKARRTNSEKSNS